MTVGELIIRLTEIARDRQAFDARVDLMIDEPDFQMQVPLRDVAYSAREHQVILIYEQIVDGDFSSTS